MPLRSDQWTTLLDTIRTGAVHRHTFSSVDLSALNADAFQRAVDYRDLISVEIRVSVVPSSFVTDELIRSCVAKGVRQLWSSGNRNHTPPTISDDAVTDFFFPVNAAPGQHRDLMLEAFGVTEMFAAKFFEVSTDVLRNFCSVLLDY